MLVRLQPEQRILVGVKLTLIAGRFGFGNVLEIGATDNQPFPKTYGAQ